MALITAIMTGILYVIIGLLFMSGIGSAILRFGSVVAEKIRSSSSKADPDDVVPEPDFFHGFRIAICVNALALVLGGIVWFVAPTLIDSVKVELSTMYWMLGAIATVASFALTSGIIALVLPTTIGRGTIINTLYYIIMGIVIGIIVGIGIYAFGR